MPPAMERIVKYVCSTCRSGIDVDVDLKEARGLTPVEGQEEEDGENCLR